MIKPIAKLIARRLERKQELEEIFTKRRKRLNAETIIKKNKEEITSRHKAYYLANKEKQTLYNKAYRELNKEKIAAQRKAREETQKGLS